MPSRPCPAVIRRLTAAREWLDATVAPSFVFFRAVDLRRSRVKASESILHWVQRAGEIAEQRIPDVPLLLERWQSVSFPVQPCLCDVWHDHVLFTGDELTGLIDFGAVKLDNVTVDLARLLGSLVGDDAALTEVGLNAYAEIRPLSELERALVPVLDRTGAVLALANWLRRLWQHGPEHENPSAVAARLASLVGRIENW